MMNGREKSGPAIVAVKPANETVGSVEEPVEPRAGAKGNAGEIDTRRALDRESVAQGLDRIRQAARRERRALFTSLLTHVKVPLLREAFYALKRDAAPGVDGM